MNPHSIKKYLCFTVIVIAVLAALCGCGEHGNEVKESETSTSLIVNEPAETTAAEAEQGIFLIQDGKAQYDVIYPIINNDVEKAAAQKLIDEFKAATGLKMKSFDDYVEVGQSHDPDTYEILVGFTAYEQSAQVYADVRYGEYKIVSVGRKIVIAAHTEQQFDEAIAWLSQNVFNKAVGEGDALQLKLDAPLDMQGGGGEYEIDSWTINGNSLGLYRFVYADIDIYETLVAMRLELAQKSGYYLDIVRDLDSKPTEYEILIGNTNRNSEPAQLDYLHYCFGVSGNRLVLSSGGLHSLNKTISSFVSILSNSQKDVKITSELNVAGNYLDDPFENTQMADGADIRVMSCNILAEYLSYNGRIPVSLRKEVFFAALDYYQPTIIGLQEFSPAWFECFPEYRDADKYEVLKVLSPNGKDYYFSTILYRKDILELIEWDAERYSIGNNARGRCAAYGAFRIKATGKTFGFISTHLDGFDHEYTDTQIKELAAVVERLKQYGAVIATGDFNTNENMADYADLQSAMTMYDMKYHTDRLLNSETSYHDLGIMPSGEGLALDHIFGTQDTVCRCFEMLIYNEQIWGSDHSWPLADVTLN